MAGVVIVGAGQAGGRTALTLRKEGYAGPVTLIGGEPIAPYQRPPLSKAVLLGTKEVEDGYLVSPSDYASQDIDLRLGVQAAEVDTARRSVTLTGGPELDYDALVFATGARPNRLAVPGHELGGVYLFRTARDAQAIRDVLEPGARIVIVGGGFIGLEVAASARQRQCAVTVLEAQERLLARSLPPEAASAIGEIHRLEGVDIVLGAGVEAFEGGGRLEGVRLADGRVLPADAVVVGIGIRPDTALAEAAGLEVDDGIVVDACCRAGEEPVYAVGDCARAYLARYGRHVRLESFRNADMQAVTAAKHIAGEPVPYDPVPWLWSQQFDWLFQTAGFPAAADRVVSRGGVEAGHMLFFGLERDALTGVVGVGRGAAVARDVRMAQMIMERGLSPAAEELADPERPLKMIMQSAV